jgi:hypothetical protein
MMPLGMKQATVQVVIVLVAGPKLVLSNNLCQTADLLDASAEPSDACAHRRQPDS